MTTTKKTPTKNRTAVMAADQALIDGTAQNKASLPASFTVGTQTYKPDDVVALLENRITTSKAAVTAAAERTAASKTADETRAQSKLVVDTYRSLVILLFLQSPTVLATFGLAAPKPRTPSAATKAAGAAKATAKRKAKKAAVDAVDAGAPAPAADATAPTAATPTAAPVPPPAAAPAAKPAS
ncbi:MAG TPA: hypothetical protein VGL81_15820 [Polyangiaceae bacterium]|jgi:hypothetical protein